MSLNIFTGHLRIPEGTKLIRAFEYEGDDRIISVTVPGSVKSIEHRAFADCRSLREIKLCEGIEEIAPNVFTGCSKLKSVQLPESVKNIGGRTFYDSGLCEPVFGASGKILVYCPESAAGRSYTVPSQVKEIETHAFSFLKNLETVRLPEGLETIRERAFFDCGMREITIPSGIRTIEEGAFRKCRNLIRINGLYEDDPLKAALSFWRARGETFADSRRFPLPADQYWKTGEFRDMAGRCAEGNAQAMEELADYFHERAAGEKEEGFFTCAENFWRYRAWEYGSQKAEKWMRDWALRHPGEQMSTPFLSERLSGRADGVELNALGFLFFNEAREEYVLYARDQEGVVQVSAYESEDGPDEDGFGMEIYYYWWYLDDCLNPVPGVDCLGSYSSVDLRMKSSEQKFEQAHAEVAAAICRKKQERNQT